MVKASLRDFESIYLGDRKFVGGERPCIGDLIAFYDITMLEVLDYDFSGFPLVQQWIAEMRKIDGVRKADEKFEQSKSYVKTLNSKL